MTGIMLVSYTHLNLAGSENVDAERVKTVLEQVGLRERVARMKDGAHTLLGHDIGDGELLSGGEEQLSLIHI